MRAAPSCRYAGSSREPKRRCSPSRVRYEGGEGLALDVVAAQNQLAQARTNYYTTLVNYLNARADLEVAAGK